MFRFVILKSTLQILLNKQGQEVMRGNRSLKKGKSQINLGKQNVVVWLKAYVCLQMFSDAHYDRLENLWFFYIMNEECYGKVTY